MHPVIEQSWQVPVALISYPFMHVSQKLGVVHFEQPATSQGRQLLLVLVNFVSHKEHTLVSLQREQPGILQVTQEPLNRLVFSPQTH